MEKNNHLENQVIFVTNAAYDELNSSTVESNGNFDQVLTQGTEESTSSKVH